MTNYFAQFLLLIFAVNASVCVCAKTIQDASDPHAQHQNDDCLHSGCMGECGEEIAIQANTADKPNTPLKNADSEDAAASAHFSYQMAQLPRATGPPDFPLLEQPTRLRTPVTRKDRLTL